MAEYKSIFINNNKNLKRKRGEDDEGRDSDHDGDDQYNPDSSFKFDKTGKLIAYPKNIKFMDSRSFNLEVQQEDSDLIHRLIHITTGLIPNKIKEQKDAVTLNLLTEKDLSTNKIMNYIIQISFPRIPITLDELTQVKLYSPDRIVNIEIDYDEENRKTVLNINLLSSTNHVYFKSRTLYVDYSSVQHYTINDNTIDYDTNFMKRKTTSSQRNNNKNK